MSQVWHSWVGSPKGSTLNSRGRKPTDGKCYIFIFFFFLGKNPFGVGQHFRDYRPWACAHGFTGHRFAARTCSSGWGEAPQTP